MTTTKDENDTSGEKSWWYEQRAKAAQNSLQKRNMNAQYVPDMSEALSAILGMIPSGAVVARGDSITVDQVGVFPALKKRGQNRVIEPLERNAEGLYIHETEERRSMQREMFSSDVFLTSANAVTLDGKLVSTDGMGSRVAATIYGPDKVIVVAGANKIVKDVNEALERVRQVAAPLNAKRHYLKHKRESFADLPCVRTGRCVDCNHESRICRSTVIIEGCPMQYKGRINVILVGEELGL
jgi:hypothetical protein